jgi:uncharacterized protein
MHPRAAELVASLGLAPHPEGGFYREIYRSSIAPDGRVALTTIYYLLSDDDRSRWHRVTSDEVWHLYEGGPLELLELSAAGEDLVTHRLARVGDGAPVHTIAASRWQAARLLGDYVLVGCTVAPGFEFADFRLMADDPEVAARVRARWPHVAAFI